MSSKILLLVGSSSIAFVAAVAIIRGIDTSGGQSQAVIACIVYGIGVTLAQSAAKLFLRVEE